MYQVNPQLMHVRLCLTHLQSAEEQRDWKTWNAEHPYVPVSKESVTKAPSVVKVSSAKSASKSSGSKKSGSSKSKDNVLWNQYGNNPRVQTLMSGKYLELHDPILHPNNPYVPNYAHATQLPDGKIQLDSYRYSGGSLLESHIFSRGEFAKLISGYSTIDGKTWDTLKEMKSFLKNPPANSPYAAINEMYKAQMQGGWDAYNKLGGNARMIELLQAARTYSLPVKTKSTKSKAKRMVSITDIHTRLAQFATDTRDWKAWNASHPYIPVGSIGHVPEPPSPSITGKTSSKSKGSRTGGKKSSSGKSRTSTKGYVTPKSKSSAKGKTVQKPQSLKSLMANVGKGQHGMGGHGGLTALAQHLQQAYQAGAGSTASSGGGMSHSSRSATPSLLRMRLGLLRVQQAEEVRFTYVVTMPNGAIVTHMVTQGANGKFIHNEVIEVVHSNGSITKEVKPMGTLTPAQALKIHLQAVQQEHAAHLASPEGQKSAKAISSAQKATEAKSSATKTSDKTQTEIPLPPVRQVIDISQAHPNPYSMFDAQHLSLFHTAYGSSGVEQVLSRFSNSSLRDISNTVGVTSGKTAQETANRLAQYQIVKDGLLSMGKTATPEERALYDAAVKSVASAKWLANDNPVKQKAMVESGVKTSAVSVKTMLPGSKIDKNGVEIPAHDRQAPRLDPILLHSPSLSQGVDSPPSELWHALGGNYATVLENLNHEPDGVLAYMLSQSKFPSGPKTRADTYIEGKQVWWNKQPREVLAGYIAAQLENYINSDHRGWIANAQATQAAELKAALVKYGPKSTSTKSTGAKGGGKGTTSPSQYISHTEFGSRPDPLVAWDKIGADNFEKVLAGFPTAILDAMLTHPNMPPGPAPKSYAKSALAKNIAMRVEAAKSGNPLPVGKTIPISTYTSKLQAMKDPFDPIEALHTFGLEQLRQILPQEPTGILQAMLRHTGMPPGKPPRGQSKTSLAKTIIARLEAYQQANNRSITSIHDRLRRISV